MTDQQHEYILLDRLKQDCFYYFDNGCRLWGIAPKDHAYKMVELYNQLLVKPEWLKLDELKELCNKLIDKELNLYRLHCQSRKTYSIGIPDKHIEYVLAFSEEEAKDSYRAGFDYDKRDYLLIKRVEIVQNYE